MVLIIAGLNQKAMLYSGSKKKSEAYVLKACSPALGALRWWKLWELGSHWKYLDHKEHDNKGYIAIFILLLCASLVYFPAAVR